jgi:hypothetical protein
MRPRRRSGRRRAINRLTKICHRQRQWTRRGPRSVVAKTTTTTVVGRALRRCGFRIASATHRAHLSCRPACSVWSLINWPARQQRDTRLCECGPSGARIDWLPSESLFVGREENGEAPNDAIRAGHKQSCLRPSSSRSSGRPFRPSSDSPSASAKHLVVEQVGAFQSGRYRRKLCSSDSAGVSRIHCCCCERAPRRRLATNRMQTSSRYRHTRGASSEQIKWPLIRSGGACLLAACV